MYCTESNPLTITPIPALPPNPTRWCLRCQYPLNAVTDNRCPECGKGFDPDDPATFITDPVGRKLNKYAPWIFVGAIALLAIVDIVSQRLFGSDVGQGVAIAVLVVGPMAVGVYLFVRRQFRGRK